MTDEPKITVIIPTRERCDVLASSLRTITAQAYGNLDIIVSDNFSNDSTADVIKRACDSRIRYLNPGKRLSMSHNWEFALSHVDDGWVTFVGDDDGLLPDSVSRVAALIKATGAQAIRSNFCTYDWPAVSGTTHGELIVPMTSGIEVRNSGRWLDKVMLGRQKYNQLPMLYNGGFIHISPLKEARKRGGAFFLSVSPDVYSAIAISSIVESYVYCKEPLAISGTSKHSTGNSFFSLEKNRSLSPKMQFTNEGNLPFHGEMPLCADGGYPISLQACAYEAYLQTRPLRSSGTEFGHAEQLEVIMATAGAHRVSIEEWGRRFAELHGIDYVRAKNGAARKRAFLQPYAMARKIFNAANSVITENLPIRNVHEASIAAAVIRASAGRADTLGFFAKRILSRKT